MADNISAADILAPFQTISSINDNDMVLLQANRTSGGTGTQTAARIMFSLLKAYILKGREASPIVAMTQDEYDALSPADKNNGQFYAIVPDDDSSSSE